MQFVLCDKDLRSLLPVDMFTTAIWTERFSDSGDAELHIPAIITLDPDTGEARLSRDIFKEDYFLVNPESDSPMIITLAETKTDVEDGPECIVTAKTYDSVLHRRIIWTQTVLENVTPHEAVKRLLMENAISPSDPSRVIPRLTFVDNPTLAASTTKISVQFTGDDLFDAIKAICDSVNIGFKCILNNDIFEFHLYEGTNRTRNNLSVPFVEFSDEYDNVINSDYIETKENLKTVTLVAGEGEGIDRKTTVVAIDSGAGSGLDRRELYTDARDISSTIDGGTLTPAQYTEQLAQRGKEKLAENIITKMFDCETPKYGNFQFNVDYFLGDIVSYCNEYGIETEARVIEYIQSHDSNGEEAYPTFAVVE